MSPSHDTSAWDPDALPPLRGDDGLVLLATASMQARRRLPAILGFWGWQLGFALLIAWPAASAVSAFYGASPSGDSPLWAAGGHALGDLLLVARGARGALVTLAALTFLIAGFADLVPIAAVITSVGFISRDLRPPSLRAALSRGTAAFPTFSSLFGMAALLELLLAGTAFALANLVAARATEQLGEARGDQLGWLVGLVVLAAAAVVGVLHDLARAGAIRFRIRTVRACRCALTAFLRSPAALVWSWAWRAGAGWAPVAVGALLASKVGGHGGLQLLALAVVHQLCAVARVALRTSWLASALRAVDRAHRVIRPR